MVGTKGNARLLVYYKYAYNPQVGIALKFREVENRVSEYDIIKSHFAR
jgi:hypothetical protein